MDTISNNNPIKRNLEIIKIINPRVIFVDKQNYNYLKKSLKKFKNKNFDFGRFLFSYKENGIKKNSIEFVSHHKDNDLAMIFTSGSTGEPKGVP